MTEKKERLLEAAERLMLQRGYWGTTVDEVCSAAAVSKGSFFHYFEDKEQLAIAALDQFVLKMVGRVREALAGREPADVYGRVCAYCDLIARTVQVQQAQEGCLIAAFTMESRSDDSAFARRCAAHFGNWIELLRRELAAAIGPENEADPALPDELAKLCVCVIEGALVLARGLGDPQIAGTALEHLKRYLGTVLNRRTAADGESGARRPAREGAQVRGRGGGVRLDVKRGGARGGRRPAGARR